MLLYACGKNISENIFQIWDTIHELVCLNFPLSFLHVKAHEVARDKHGKQTSIKLEDMINFYRVFYKQPSYPRTHVLGTLLFLVRPIVLVQNSRS